MDLIKSCYYSDLEIISAISKLYLKDKPFELDPTFSKGNIYKGGRMPTLKYDLHPKSKDVGKADVSSLPFRDNSIESIMFDPPFLWGIRPCCSVTRDNNNKMAKRFTMFENYEDMAAMYTGGIVEFYRILKPGGVLAFKCQDRTDVKTTMTHCLVYQWATEKGFYVEDFFIKLVKHRIYNPKLTQRHSRKLHCYYYVFKK